LPHGVPPQIPARGVSEMGHKRVEACLHDRSADRVFHVIPVGQIRVDAVHLYFLGRPALMERPEVVRGIEKRGENGERNACPQDGSQERPHAFSTVAQKPDMLVQIIRRQAIKLLNARIQENLADLPENLFRHNQRVLGIGDDRVDDSTNRLPRVQNSRLRADEIRPPVTPTLKKSVKINASTESNDASIHPKAL
jgi:hypothetical protein